MILLKKIIDKHKNVFKKESGLFNKYKIGEMIKHTTNLINKHK